MIEKIVRTVVGIALIALGVALAVTTPSMLMTVGRVSLLLQVFGQQSLTVVWRLLLLPVLFVVGASFLLPILDDPLARTSIGTKRWSLIIGFGWCLPYLVYMVLRSLNGRPMVLNAFDFSRPGDLVYLILLSFFAAICFRMTLRPGCIADVKTTFVGLVGGTFLGACTSLWGPNGFPEGHLLHAVVFMGLPPLLLLTPIGAIAMSINLLRSGQSRIWPARLRTERR